MSVERFKSTSSIISEIITITTTSLHNRNRKLFLLPLLPLLFLLPLSLLLVLLLLVEILRVVAPASLVVVSAALVVAAILHLFQLLLPPLTPLFGSTTATALATATAAFLTSLAVIDAHHSNTTSSSIEICWKC